MSVSFIEPVPDPAELLMPATTLRTQLKFAGVLLVGVYENGLLLHTDGGV
jgi:hypothetical protein